MSSILDTAPLAPEYIARVKAFNARPLADRLQRIRVIYCAPDTLAYYGIPYEMNREVGQAPRHIHERYRGDWIWLGSPGWWGTLGSADVQLCEAFLAQHRAILPGAPYEWVTLPCDVCGYTEAGHTCCPPETRP